MRPSSARSGQLGKVRSARLGLTMYDLQFQKVITPSCVLRLYGKAIESKIHPYIAL